ncbi:MAG: cysteine desulfurase [Tissierellia bacterium]|nr:cysteine desulfurase [Tissierellia bacterium]
MIYLDSAGTTKMDKRVIDVMNESFENDFANPSSLHSLGFQVEKKMRKSREAIANQLGVLPDNIFFVPSATIANNAVVNSVGVKSGQNVVLSKVEHSSMQRISENFDGEFRYVGVCGKCFVDIEELLELVDDNTVLVSIIHVNNEIGSINDIEEISRRVKEKNPNVLVHSDGVQAFKKIDISLKNIDFYTVAGHKINGPKGIAALYVKNPNKFTSLYFGGGQEKGLFSSTENTYGIFGIGEAAKLDNNYEKIVELNKYLREEIVKIEGVKIISPEENVSPFILSVHVENIGSEVLLHYLEMDGIFLSSGSACSKGKASRVLKAIGLSDEQAKGVIRISFDRNSNKEQVDIFLEKLKEKIEIIRGILKR